jgi:hypothetical protein
MKSISPCLQLLLVGFAAFFIRCANHENRLPVVPLASEQAITSNQALLYEDTVAGGQLILLSPDEASFQVQQEDRVLFDGVVSRSRNLTVETRTFRVSANGLEVPVKLIPAGGMLLWKVGGEGTARHLLLQGSCWVADMDQCKVLSRVDQEIVNSLRRTGDVYILTSTVNISNEERFALAAAQISAAGVNDVDTVVATSAGTFTMAALDQAGVLSYRRAFLFIGPFGGLLDGYQNAAIGNSGIVAAFTPEAMDYVSGSQFVRRRIESWCQERKADTSGKVHFIGLDFGRMNPANDLLMPVQSHFACAANEGNRTLFKSDRLSHYNVGDDSWAATRMVELIGGGRLVAEIVDPREGEIAEFLADVAAGGITINGISVSVSSEGTAVSGLVGTIGVEIHASDRSVWIGDVEIGRYSRIVDGKLIGYQPLLVAHLPASVAAALQQQSPGLQVGAAYLTIDEGKLRGLVQVAYHRDSLRGLFLAELSISQSGVSLSFRSDGAVLYNALAGGGFISWKIDRLTMAIVNGKFEGELAAGAALRVEMSVVHRIGGPDLDSLMRELHLGVMQSLVLSFVTQAPPSPDPTWTMLSWVIRNNLALRAQAAAEFKSTVYLR